MMFVIDSFFKQPCRENTDTLFLIYHQGYYARYAFVVKKTREKNVAYILKEGGFDIIKKEISNKTITYINVLKLCNRLVAARFYILDTNYYASHNDPLYIKYKTRGREFIIRGFIDQFRFALHPGFVNFLDAMGDELDNLSADN